MLKTKLKKGDTVIVRSGKHKGATGKIIKVITKTSRVLVEGVALVKKHKRATQQGEKSEIIQKESSIHISNVGFYDAKNKKPAKLGFKIEDKKKVRVNKKTGEAV